MKLPPFFNDLAVSITEDDEDGLSRDLKLYAVALAIEMLDLVSDLELNTGAAKEMAKLATGVNPFALPGEEQLSDLDKTFIAGGMAVPTTVKGPLKKVKRLMKHLGNTRFIKSSSEALKASYDSVVSNIRKKFKKDIPIGPTPLPIPQSTKKSEEMIDTKVKLIGRNPDKTLKSGQEAFRGNNIGFSKGTDKDVFADKRRSQHAARHLTDAGILPNWSNKTYEKFKEIGTEIVENPLNTFNHRLRDGKAVKGFHGKVDGKDVVIHVYKEGPNATDVATAVVPSQQQMINWGLNK